MTFEKYQTNALRTLKHFDSVIENTHHCVTGLVGEFLSEVTPMLTSGLINKNNLEEELGDCLWYCANYCTIQKINFKPYKEKPNTDIILAMGELLEQTKKEKYYNKEFNIKDKTFLIQSIIYFIIKIGETYNIKVEEMMKKNIQKLRIRYPDKFEEDKAINKDEKNEKKVWEK